MKGVFLLQDIREDQLLNPQNLMFYYQVNGWFAGGHNSGSKSMIDRIIYAVDTTVASVRSYLSTVKDGVAGVHNATYGWWAGEQNRCDRMTYANDTANAIGRAFLNGNDIRCGYATDCNNYGWWVAGYGSGYKSYIQRIIYALDTTTATKRSNMYTGIFQHSSSYNTTDGWFAGGAIQSGVSHVSTVTRLTYSTDTTSPPSKGGLPIVLANHSGMGNLTDGWLGGGYNGGGYITNIYRINYATDTAAANVRNNRLNQADQIGTSCNNTDGWWAGGNRGGYFTSVERTTFASDTNINLARGPISFARGALGGL